MEIDGKVTVVTGAASGIGGSAAIALAREGADLVLDFLTMPVSFYLNKLP